MYLIIQIVLRLSVFFHFVVFCLVFWESLQCQFGLKKSGHADEDTIQSNKVYYSIHIFTHL